MIARSRRNGRRRKAARNEAIAAAPTTPVSRRLPYSIAPWVSSSVWMTAPWHSGHVGQPSPEPVRRTAAPVKTIAVSSASAIVVIRAYSGGEMRSVSAFVRMRRASAYPAPPRELARPLVVFARLSGAAGAAVAGGCAALARGALVAPLRPRSRSPGRPRLHRALPRRARRRRARAGARGLRADVHTALRRLARDVVGGSRRVGRQS